MPAQHREYSLSALVAIQSLLLFVMAPLSVTPGVPRIVIASLVATVLAANVAAVLAIVRRTRTATLAVALAVLTELAAVVLRSAQPSARTEALDFSAALLALMALTVVLGYAVFGPGRVTVHRILGAIAIYLNVAAAFALAYRTIDAPDPNAFFRVVSGAAMSHTLAGFIYFSFTTLTTTGFGDIVPVNAFARSLANVESVIGQLFPATLLARLITLELEHRREAP